jgi:polyhydroxyalkanoate synthase
VDDLEAQQVDWHDVERARFAVNALTSALAPTNTPLGNPAALKHAFDTAGASLLRGLKNFAHDVRHNGGMPSQTDRTAFTVGKDLALTPGAVVDRTEVAELIQYAPSTPKVRQRPVLVIPPPIGRYYFLDLRPGRSFVEYAVSQGLQVFMLSWRNPQPEQAAWDMDDYGGGIVAAIDAVREATGSDDVNTIGFCAGGILMSTVLSHLAQTGSPVVHSASYGVTLLDFDSEAPIGAFSAPRLLELAQRDSKRKGIISARSMGTVFAWMRPDDLVFNYVINQWLMGEDPPVFDILAWNADLRDRCRERPPHAVEGLLPHDRAPVGAEHLRAQQRGTRRQPGQPAWQPQGHLLGRRQVRHGSGDLAGERREAHGQLVGGLGRVGARALR